MENLHLSGKEELALRSHGTRHSPYKLGVAWHCLGLQCGDQRGRLDGSRRGEGLILRMRNKDYPARGICTGQVSYGEDAFYFRNKSTLALGLGGAQAVAFSTVELPASHWAQAGTK
jgi:hypothetical protein